MRKSFLIFWGISIIVASYPICRSILDYRNTLSANGNWTASKFHLYKPVLGVERFFTGRQALRRNRLDLGSWHGFQEIRHKRLVDPCDISFRFKLLPGPYVACSRKILVAQGSVYDCLPTPISRLRKPVLTK